MEKQEEKKKVTEPGQAQAVQVSVKNAERAGNVRKNQFSLAVKNADEEDWQPIVYYDEYVNFYSFIYLPADLSFFSLFKQKRYLRNCMQQRRRSLYV